MDREVVRRRDLPHWDVPNAAYFVTTCLEGSIPAQGILEIARFRRDLANKTRPEGITEADWKVHCWKKGFVQIEKWLDNGATNRCLEKPELAMVVVSAMRNFAEERYDLFAFAVMPSHVHWVFQPRTDWIESSEAGGKRTPRERITHSINRYTAGQCNKLLNKAGTFWQHESFDHWIRDVDELERIIRYVEENPVKAGLVVSPEQWLYSSAYVRKALGLEWGVPIPQARSSS